MSGLPEQIKGSRGIVNANWPYIKRKTARARRALAKRLLEDAPPLNRYKGWVA